jgi:hypothetical protein
MCAGFVLVSFAREFELSADIYVDSGEMVFDEA